MAGERDKYFLTIREAANLYGIGENKIRQMQKDGKLEHCSLKNGNRYLINRKLFEQFLDEVKVI